MNENDELVKFLKNEFALELPGKIEWEELRGQLATTINLLINDNFQKLVSLLYRVDVSESRLKNLLKDHPDQDAGLIIADLIIERQLQKIKSRRETTKRDNEIDEKDKW
jgi:hypothetical protein